MPLLSVRRFHWTGSPRTWLALVVAGGFALRAWHLDHGIPYGAGVDEPVIIGRILHMMRSGDYNPHFFDYPGLYIYLQLLVGIARFLWGAIAGEWRSLAGAGPEAFYLWGRSLTVLFGTATVALVYAAGRRWGRWQGVLAAGLFAVAPTAVREAHFVLTDTPLAFFTALALLLSLRALEEPGLTRLALAGAAARPGGRDEVPGDGQRGDAAGGGKLAGRTGRGSPVTRGRGRGIRRGGLRAGGSLHRPDLPGFLNGFAELSSAYVGANPDAWRTTLIHLRLTLGWPAFVLALGGLAVAAARCMTGPDRLRWFVLAGFPAVYYLMLVAQGGLVYGRYLLPILPPACLLVACAAAPLGSRARFLPAGAGQRAAAAALALVILLPPAWRSIDWLGTMAKGTTAQLLVQWLERNVPAGSRLVHESGWGNPVPCQSLPGALHPQTGEPVRTEDYAASGEDYLIACSSAFEPALAAAKANPDLARGYMELFSRAERVATISPTKDFLGPEYSASWR